jgi:hypothetical protein
MKILLAAFVILTAGLPPSPPDSTHVDFWSWSTDKGGQKLTWIISDAAFLSLPDKSPLNDGPFPLSEAAEAAATSYVKEQLASYAQAGHYLLTRSDYRISAFGFKEVQPRFGLHTSSPSQGRWIRYLEFNLEGGAGLVVKVYLLPDGSVLRPKIEPVPAWSPKDKTS